MKKYQVSLIILLVFNFSFSQNYHLKIKENNPLTKKMRQAKFYDNSSFVFTGLDSNIYMLDLHSLQISKTISGLSGKSDCIEFSKDKSIFAATSFDNEFTIWDFKTGKIKVKIGEYQPGYVQSHTIAFLLDNKSIASTGSCDFPIYNLENGSSKDTLDALKDECFYSLVFLDDKGSYIAGGNKHVWIKNKDSETPKTKNVRELTCVNDIAYCEQKKLFAVCGRDGMLLLDEKLNKKFKLKGHTDWIRDVSFSPDGNLLYSCSGTMFGEDNTIRIWNTETGVCEKVLNGHSSDINSIDISPNGELIVSSSSDNTLKIWSTKDQNLICTIIPVKVKNKTSFLYYTPNGIFYGEKKLMKFAELYKNDAISSEKITFSKKNKKKIAKLF